MAMPHIQRSVPEVLQDIFSNLQEIVRSEVRLAKTEVKEAASRAAKPVATYAVGAVLGFYGFGCFLVAAISGLSLVMAVWLAALLVGAVLAILAVVLMSSSKNKLKNYALDKTISSVNVKENVPWTAQQIK